MVCIGQLLLMQLSPRCQSSWDSRSNICL